MTEIDNDKLLRDFFTENRQEIADRGFSRRVMHHLPDRSNRLARIWNAFVMAVGANKSRPEINHYRKCSATVYGCEKSSFIGIGGTEMLR